MNASQCLGLWLKEHPHANQVHRVLRYDRNLLVTYCGRTFPLAEAVSNYLSVACCPECTNLWRRRTEEKLQSLARKYPCKKRVQL